MKTSIRPYCLNTGLVMLVLLLANGCGTLENGRGWGQDAIYPLDLRRIPRAAYNAFFDLQTLIPAAGAALFAVHDFDERVSAWATRRNPIFGSEGTATDASDVLLDALKVEFPLTVLATASGDEPKTWAYWKAKGFAVELGAVGATAAATDFLKDEVDRARPDGSGNRSFPSGHVSGAFALATLANRNLNATHLPDEARLPLQVGNLLIATSVAWARIEGQRHFPSDVLFSAAMGHFLTAFIHDAFIGLPEDKRFGLVVLPLRGGAMASLAFNF